MLTSLSKRHGGRNRHMVEIVVSPVRYARAAEPLYNKHASGILE
jgi:hypothetical protein